MSTHDLFKVAISFLNATAFFVRFVSLRTFSQIFPYSPKTNLEFLHVHSTCFCYRPGRLRSQGGGGGGGGTLIFSAYVGSDPASTVHPQKISGISNTPKKYLKF